MKQSIVATAAKVKRHQESVDRFRQNRIFENNQGQIYRELNKEEEKCDDDQPNAG